MRAFLACLLTPLLLTSYAGAQTCPQVGASLCVPLDSTFQVPDMSGASSTDPCQRNDDGSGEIQLTGWSFDFYGTPWQSIWINNNGNVSFGQPFPTFSASGFPVSGFPMIAPFWGDVDTRNSSPGVGAVWYREWSTASGDAVNRVVVTWDNVGYYNQAVDKLNTFQVILTDGNDPLIGIGNNVCFCYDDMQWTTGSASGGTGGFGGVPATVGANRGDGVTFFQVGRFDHEGTDYDGPGGNPDGVSFLDDGQFCFSTTSGMANTAPIFLSPVTMHNVQLGQSLLFEVQAIGPEAGEVVTLAADLGQLDPGSVSANYTAGNPAIASFTYSPVAMSELGLHTVTVTATDDGTPARMSVLDIMIQVDPGGVDVTPPTCTLTNRIARVEGVARDPGSGISTISLDPSAVNLTLFVEPFSAGSPVVNWTAGRIDSSQPGAGAVEVRDVAGNSTLCVFDIAPTGDCNGNGIADSVDLANQTSYDWNSNGTPDECEQLGSVYCSPQPHNSTGLPGFLLVTGSNLVANNDVTLTGFNAPPQALSLFVVSGAPGFSSGTMSGLSSGNLCVDPGALGGYRLQLTFADQAGVFSINPDMTQVPLPTGATAANPGTRLYFQGWFRDAGSTVGNNLTDAVEVVFY